MPGTNEMEVHFLQRYSTRVTPKMIVSSSTHGLGWKEETHGES